MDSRLFSAGASRILVHALHAIRLGRTNFPTRWTFFSDCVTFVNFFARLIGLKTLCSSVAAWRLRRLVVLKHSWPMVMHIQRCRWILVTLLCAVFTSASGSTVHQSDGASKHTFCRIHGKMELCNYHWGQHCGGDCFQIDCAHGPSSRTFPPIIFLLAFRWNLRLLDSFFNSLHTLLLEER